MFAARALAVVMIGVLLAACAAPEIAVSLSPSPAVKDSSGSALALRHSSPVLLQATPTLASTPAGTPDPPIARPDVIVWWAADAYPPADSAADEALTMQLEGFRDGAAAPTLQVRVKRVEGVGGIMSTLRSASQVAPGALPDLVLLRRAHMLAAADAALIFPLNEAITPVMRRNLFPQALGLGQIDGLLYGVAYTLEIQHIVYRETVFATPPTTFEAILEAGQPFVFAAGQDGTLLVQYLAAGGRVVDDDGSPVLDEAPLSEVLTFYEQAVNDDLVGEGLLDVALPAAYWENFLNGAISLAQVDSTTFLSSARQAANVAAAPIPTEDGEALTPLTGWLWVLTTADPDRQVQAMAFLDWVMRAEHQAAFAQAMGAIPSQRTALPNWREALHVWDTAAYGALVETLLEGEAPILVEEINPVVAVALQEALAAVLTGQLSAADAAAEAVAAIP